MAKKKETLTLEEIKRCVNLYQSFHNSKFVNIEDISKELGVKRLDLWEFIQKNKYFFIISSSYNSGSKSVKWRFIKKILDSPISEEEYDKMIKDDMPIL